MLYYIFNYLKLNINLIASGFKGSTIKHISKEYLSTIKIKIPKNKKLIDTIGDISKEIEKLNIQIKESETLYTQLIQELSDDSIQK